MSGDPMDDARGARFCLMAAYGAPEVIEQFGIVCAKLGCSTAPIIRAVAIIEAQTQRARLARVSAAEAKISRQAEQGEVGRDDARPWTEEAQS
jgi:hypothetical protein